MLRHTQPTMAEAAEEYAGGDEDVAAAEQEEDVDEVSARLQICCRSRAVAH